MSLPICPKCHGSAVSPDPNSAGHDICACGHRAPVRDFHAPTDPLAKMRFNAVLPGYAPAYFSLFDPNVTRSISETGRKALKLAQSSAYGHIGNPKTVNILNQPVPKHKPVKHWSDN